LSLSCVLCTQCFQCLLMSLSCVLCTQCCQCLLIVIVLCLVYPMFPVSVECHCPVSCVPNVASVCWLSLSCVLCTQCCQCLLIAIVLCLVYPMLPVSVDCHRPVSCVPNVASVGWLSILVPTFPYLYSTCFGIILRNIRINIKKQNKTKNTMATFILIYRCISVKRSDDFTQKSSTLFRGILFIMCLLQYDIRILITPLVSSNSSY
jgi:ABC-type transport system involved in cytochrome c biogenesis permease component